jgi:Cof subfamily protein (haloacid dehalogenase superfamily)
MQNKYKLLVSDIDGTITDGNGVISAVDLKAIQDLQQAGITLSLCTGRAARGCQKVLERLPSDSFHIFFDGALVCNANQTEVIYAKPIEKELLLEVCGLAQLYRLTLELFSKKEFFVAHESPLAKEHSELLGFEYTLAEFNALCANGAQETIIMGCLVMPVDDEKKFKSLFSEFGNANRLKFSWSMNPARPDIYLVNVIKDDVSKGNALIALCAHQGFNLDQIAAIGDGSNDVSLLETAGLAIAMQNAPPELKAVADHVTADIAHNGFAQAVRKYLL